MFHSPVLCHRLFFALRPPIELARAVSEAAHWFEGGRGVLRPERLHVTLDLLEDMPAFDPALVRRLLDAASAVAVEPFRIVLDRAVGGGGSIALRPGHRSPALHALQEAIVRQRHLAGLVARNGYRFSPHLTLGYRKSPAIDEAVAPVAWDVSDFVLVHSHVGAGRHDVLGRWNLTGVDADQLALF